MKQVKPAPKMQPDDFLAGKPELQATEETILHAAITCVKKWGLERVTLNDIAYEAKVARSTVYKYYSNKDDVIRVALLHSAYDFGIRLVEYFLQYETPEDRLIEAIVYGLKKLPDEPSLMLLSDDALSHLVREHSLTTPQGLDMGSALLTLILDDREYSTAELMEMSETVIRFVISLATMSSPQQRNDDQMRGYIARRILPSLGLDVPEQYREINNG